jgi:TIR domain-containing protein/uncharacterized protein DUF4440
MAHDVFISHSKKDAAIAEAICAELEAKGIQCWIAPRNIVSGTKYSVSIMQGITQSQLMVVVYSAGANESNHVLAEIDRAYNKRIPIVPFRIEDFPLSEDLEYYLSTSQWFDAQQGPMQGHLERLVETVRSLLKKTGSLPSRPPPKPVPPIPPAPVRSSKAPWIIAGAVALLALGFVAVLAAGLIMFVLRNTNSRPPDDGNISISPTPISTQGGQGARVAAVETELLRRARKAILDAEISGDTKALASLLRQDFKTRRPNDQILTREEVIREVESGQVIEGLRVPDRTKVTVVVEDARPVANMGLMSLVKISYLDQGRVITEVRRDLTVFVKENDRFVATVNRWSNQ